ncbi:MAG: SEC-C metal-binding domain-containing protein, partial [Deltaproteobacteria bacterium]|nr:SEC-C metal-binding domain-containing protein [Deltaproteobacteria bacterium]
MNQPAALKSPGRNDVCWCGSGRKYKKCHMDQDQKSARSPQTFPDWNKNPETAEDQADMFLQSDRVRSIIKTPEQIDGIRAACRLASETLDMLNGRIEPGVTTEQINTWVHEYTL